MSEQEVQEMCELLRRNGFTILKVDTTTLEVTVRPLPVRE